MCDQCDAMEEVAGKTSRVSTFRIELSSFLNRYSMEKGSNTPDFILADYLIQCMEAFDRAVRRRGDWHVDTTEPTTADIRKKLMDEDNAELLGLDAKPSEREHKGGD